MQLKVFLVVAFVVNVACLKIKKDPSSLIENIKKGPSSLVEILKKDPSAFVESLKGADNNTIDVVIGMLQDLVRDGNSQIQALEDQVNRKKDALDGANSELVAANLNKNKAQAALEAATATKENADLALDDAERKQNTAKTDHDTAVQNYDTESPILTDENKVLGQVIELLQRIDGGPIFQLSSDSCIVNSNLDIGEILRDSAHTIHIEVVMPADHVGARQWILNLGQEGNGAHHWLWNSNDEIQFGVWDSNRQITGKDIRSCSSLTTTYGDGELKLYCNGNLIGSLDCGQDCFFNINESKLAIAVASYQEQNFKGCVKKVKVWNRKLSGNEVNQLST